MDLGTYKHGGRRGIRDDGISVGEGKPLRRGGPSSYGTHEVCLLYYNVSYFSVCRCVFLLCIY